MNIKKRIGRKFVSLISPILWKRYFSKKPEKVSWKGKRFALTLSFDMDYPEDYNALDNLLELLDSYNITGSFACIGKFIEKYPRKHEKILDRGHEIINHSYSHPNGYFVSNRFFNSLSLTEMREEVVKMQEIAKKYLEYEPVGFRTPHFGELTTNRIYQILEEEGFLYSSSTTLTYTQSYGLPYYPSKENFRKRGKNAFNILELPLFPCPEHYFSVFDTWHMYRSSPPAHDKEGEFVKLFKKAINIGKKYGIYINLYFDPRDLNKEFEEAVRMLVNEEKVWIVRSEEIARWWKTKNQN